MKTMAFVLLVALGMGGLWSYQARRFERLRAEGAALKSELEGLRTKTQAAARDLQEIAPELAKAEQRESAQKNAHEKQDPFVQKVYPLMEKAAELYEFLEKMPQATIPELVFLTESDWLELGQSLDLAKPNGLQIAFAHTRARAKKHFLDELDSALTEFKEKNPTKMPATLADLKNYFPKEVSDEVLARWDIPDRSNWPGLAKMFAEASGDLQLAVIEKAVPKGGFEMPACMFVSHKNGRTITSVTTDTILPEELVKK